MTDEDHKKSEPAMKYEVEVRSDGIKCIRTTIQSESEAISFSKECAQILDAIDLGLVINELETYCTLVDGHLIIEKSEGIPDDLRLAVTAAVSYPDGISDKIVQEKLVVKPDSRKAYVNSPLKRTSKYLSYDKKAKSVHINPEGIRWALSELKSKETKNLQQLEQIEEQDTTK